MEEPILDPNALVSYLFAEFDGTNFMAAQIRSAMFRAVSSLPDNHPVREEIESVARDMNVAVFVMTTGSRIEAYKAHLIDCWKDIALQIRRARIH